jgi:dynein light intermediate chain 2
MPFPTYIVGCKFDLYEKYDTENRKWLTRTLRYLAHINNCSLYFSSTKNAQVGAQLRNSFYEHLFNDAKSKSYAQKDHLKAIYINRGHDSINSLGIPSSGSLGLLDILKKQISSLFMY